MQELMLNMVNSFGYFGVFFLIFIENVFPPIPSEIVLLFGGAATVTTSLEIIWVIVCSTLGSVAGALVLYFLGHIFQADRLKRLFAGRFGQITRLRPRHVEMAESWFVKYEKKAVLICRCIPIVRSIISVPAGFSKMNIPLFLLLTTVGSAVWNTILTCIGAFLGRSWEAALPFISGYSRVVLIVCVAAAIAAVAYYIVKRIKKRNKKK